MDVQKRHDTPRTRSTGKWGNLLMLLAVQMAFTSQARPATPGFYLGAQGGLVLGDSRARNGILRNGVQGTETSDLSGRSPLGGVLAGGGGYWGPVYLGLEGHFSYQEVLFRYRDNPNFLTDNTGTFSLRQSMGIAGRIGFKPLKQTLLYAKLGCTWGKWAGRLIANPFGSGARSSLLRPGFSGGFGVESPFCKTSSGKDSGHLLWGLEFLYTGFSSFKVKHPLGTLSVSPRVATIAAHIRWVF